MRILNTIHEDFHVHSLNFSDGANTIDELAKFAGKTLMTTLTITDHSQKVRDTGYAKSTTRGVIKRRKNVRNNVKVNFGVEGDILNEAGDISTDILGQEGSFTLLSAHNTIYTGEDKNITEAYLNALDRHHDKIHCLGHIAKKRYAPYIDIDKIVDRANQYSVAFELNCCNLINEKTDLTLLDRMLSRADQIYVNSDAHCLSELKEARQVGREYLKNKGFIE